MMRMAKLGDSLASFLGEVEQDSESNRKQARVIQVRERYREVVKSSYPTTYQLVLDHTNSVYILMKEGVKTLIVYVDDSIFAAELNAQRELIRLKLLELFGEEVEQFDIHVSRGNYKQNHPYLVENEEEDNRTSIEFVALDEEELKCVSETSSVIEDEKVRKALESAMQANFKLQKIESDHQHVEKKN